MNRMFASALVLASISGFGVIGCADKAKEEVKVETTTPTGTTTDKTTHEVKSTEPGGAAAVPGAPAKP